MVERDLFAKIEQLAEETQVTGAVPDLYKELFSLPEAIRGERILDVCSGYSIFSDWALEQGAKPTAIDINYGNLDRLQINLVRTFASVLMQEGIDYDAEVADIFQSLVLAFNASFATNPSLYITGSATHLPIKDNSFDRMVSLNGIFGTLDHDREILMQSLKEAIRVVKVGGKIHLAPSDLHPTLTFDEYLNQNLALLTLGLDPNIDISREKKVVFDESYSVVTITKRA